MKIQEKQVTVRWIEFDGIKYYPDRRGYWLGHVDGRPKRLHISVWEKHNGSVPIGYHVHHIDHDTNNNAISNLVLMPKSEHLSYHGNLQNIEKLRKNMEENARPAASEWHKSEEGRAWHKKQYEISLGDKWDEIVVKDCAVCGQPFEAHKLIEKRTRFCSDACKSQHRRNVGIDNYNRPCDICKTPVWTNKYAPKRYCSQECRLKGLRRTRERNKSNS